MARRDILPPPLAQRKPHASQAPFAGESAYRETRNDPCIAKVVSLAFSPRRRWIASGSEDGTIKLWIAATGACVGRFEGHKYAVTALAYSADGRQIASGSEDGTIKLWNVATGACVGTFGGHKCAVTALAYSADGRQIASGSKASLVELWNVTKGNFARCFFVGGPAVTALAYSADGRQIVFGSKDGTVKLRNAEPSKSVHTLFRHESEVTWVAYAPDGGSIRSGSRKGIAWHSKWGPCRWQTRWVLTRGTRDPSPATYSPDGRSVLPSPETYSPDGCSVLIANSGSVDPAAGPVQSAAFHHLHTRTGRRIRSFGKRSSQAPLKELPRAVVDHMVGFLAPKDYYGGVRKTCRALQDLNPHDATPIWLRPPGKGGHKDFVLSAAFSPSGGRIASGSKDGKIRVWDAQTGALVHTLTGHANGVLSLTFSPRDNLLASGSEDDKVRVWDAKEGRLAYELTGSHSSHSRVYSLAFSPHDNLLASGSDDGNLLASGSDDGTVTVWDAKEGRLAYELTGSHIRVHSVAFSPRDNLLASGSEDGTVTMWDTKEQRPKYELTGQANRVRSVAFSPCGHWLASGSRDPEIRVWDAKTGSLDYELKGHECGTTLLVYRPAGKELISGSFDSGAIFVHQARSRGIRRKVPSNLARDRVRPLALSQDGHLLLAAGPKGTFSMRRISDGTHLHTFGQPVEQPAPDS